MIQRRWIEFVTLGIALSFVAPVLADTEVCRPVDKVVNSVVDEPCDAVVHEAELCFDKLNERYSHLKRLPGKSRAERLSSIAKLRSEYEAVLATLSSYYKYVKNAGDNACTDQAGAMEVWIDETESDLNDLKKPGF